MESLLNGIKLYYESYGNGPAVVFLHGLGSSSRDWRDQVDHFKDHCRVIVYDMRGHGRSAKPREQTSVAELCTDLKSLLDYLEIQQASLIGISLGGVVALQFALDYPQYIHKLVLTNSFVELPNKTFIDRLELYKRIVLIKVLGMRLFAKILAGKLFPQKEMYKLREQFIHRWSKNDTHAYLNIMRCLPGWSVKDRLKNLHRPVLIVSSEFDYTPIQAKRHYAAMMPDAQIRVINEAHHAVSVEYPHKYNQVIDQFLKEQA